MVVKAGRGVEGRRGERCGAGEHGSAGRGTALLSSVAKLLLISLGP